MPAPPEVVDSVVESTVQTHAQRQSQVAYAAALLFFANAGLSDDDLERWLRAYLPWQREAILDAARRGYGYGSLLWSLQTDNAPEGIDVDLEDSELVSDLLRRSEQYADRPVIRSRWEASKRKQDGAGPTPNTGNVGRTTTVDDLDVTSTVDTPAADVSAVEVDVPRTPDPKIRPEVDRAQTAARQAGLLPSPTEDNSTLAESMESGASRAAEQAMSETNEAFGAGMDTYAQQPGKTVARWLKAPHAGACQFCFLVSTRGYRSAQAAMAAGHRTCKCGAKVVYVEPRRNRRANQAEVSNWFWGEELQRQGYGLLFGAGELDADARLAVVQELFPDLEFPTRA